MIVYEVDGTIEVKIKEALYYVVYNTLFSYATYNEQLYLIHSI
jgi:hypothetical protein